MKEENISQEFRLKNTDETRNYFLEEIEQSELIRKKHKKVGTTLKTFLFELLQLPDVFQFLLGIFIGITRSAIGLKVVQQLQQLKSTIQ